MLTTTALVRLTALVSARPAYASRDRFAALRNFRAVCAEFNVDADRVLSASSEDEARSIVFA